MAYKRRVKKECAGCKALRPESEAPDPCLGTLPGVRFACCGHGGHATPYVAYEGDGANGVGRVVRGEVARQEMRAMGGNPAEPTRPASDFRNWLKVNE